jgi:hypothetical protein
MSQTTKEDRCRGVLIGLAAGDRIDAPIRMAGGFNPAEIVAAARNASTNW